jgi:hypothetical protein
LPFFPAGLAGDSELTGQVQAGVRSGGGGDLLRRALGDEASPPLAPLGPQVEHPVGLGDDVEVVLNDQHRVPGVAQLVEADEELLDVREMEPRGRLVQHVEGTPGGAAGQLLG